MTIDVQQYLKRVQNGYDATNIQNVNTQKSVGGQEVSGIPSEFYKGDGSVDFKRLENFYKSRNNVHEEMTGYNPIDKKVYSLSGNSDNFQWDHPILYAEPFSNGIDKIQTSSSIMSATEIDNLLYHSIMPEYQDKFAEMLAQTEGNTLHEKLTNLYQHGSGIITSADFSDLSTATLNARLVTTTQKANILAGFFETIPTTELVIPFEEFEPPSVQEDLGELEIPRTVQGRYTGFNIGLKKDGWHMAWTRFFTGQGRRRNVIQDHLTWLAQDFDRVINERIATILNTLTSVGGSSWSSFASATDLRNQNNPLAIINTVRQTLKNNGYPAQFSLSNLRVFQDYDNNTNVKGSLNTLATVAGDDGTTTLPKYGWRHGIDDTLADSTFWVLNENVASRVQGAVINITYTEPKAQVFGAIGYNYNNFAVKKTSAGRRIISIT
jgi:hypothetical protein